MPAIKPVSTIGWGGTGLNDNLRSLLARVALSTVLENVAAKSATGIHASRAGNAANNAFPGPFAAIATPRNATCVFAASYDGGNITLEGTDQWDKPQTEVITATPNSTVVGTKIWKTLTKATKATVGANAAGVSIGTGDKLGLGYRPVATGMNKLEVGGAAEAATLDAVNGGFTPTTLPNGTADYVHLGNPS